MIQQIAARRVSENGQPRIGNRKKVSVPARLTWRDASDTLRFVSVVMRDVSDVDAFVECQVPASIPLYRLVHFQVERPVRDGELPVALQEGKVLSAIYRVGPHKTSTGTPMGYALRLLVEPKSNTESLRPTERRTGRRQLGRGPLLPPVACEPAEQVLVRGRHNISRHLGFGHLRTNLMPKLFSKGRTSFFIRARPIQQRECNA